MADANGMLTLKVHAIRDEAVGIRSLDLRPVSGDDLPCFSAGAHIDVVLPNAISRSYSLVNPQNERFRYVIAVGRDAASRGGSAFIHEKLRVGDIIDARPPRNNFPLDEAAGMSLFIAGGIGITPIWSMIQRLHQLGRQWRLHYCTRTRRQAAFLPALAEIASRGGALYCNFDHEPGGNLLDIAAIVRDASPETQLYCCGPVSMLTAFEAACAGRPPSLVHLEYFTARDLPSLDGAFTVVLARAKRSFVVEPGETILKTLLDHGFDVPFSCQEGVCGSCETAVLEGIPNHRDLVLDDDEKGSNSKMMICCSGAKSERLVLDL